MRYGITGRLNSKSKVSINFGVMVLANPGQNPMRCSCLAVPVVVIVGVPVKVTVMD
jgi:hypothetical protein